MNKVQILFNKYAEKYQLYDTDFIIDKMLDDKVISFKEAKLLREGKSIFNFGHNYSNSFESNTDVTKIMGGYFSAKTINNTNFNRKIEPTKQPFTSGACWLLSDINSLKETDWGRYAIKEAIIPDTDGKGGVTVTFKGSPLEKKEVYISAEDIINAKNIGLYSSGDDDMIAFELATEKTFKEMVQQGLAIRANNDEVLEKKGFEYRHYINGGISTSEYQQYPISKLLGLKSDFINFYLMNGYNSADCLNDKDIILKEVAKNKENISLWCAFSSFTENKYVHGGHAYAVKAMKYGEFVVLNDPHYPEKEIQIPWKDFVGNITDMSYSTNKINIISSLKKKLPDYYKEANEEFEKRFNKFNPR